MTITLLLKILEKKIEFLKIGPFGKMAKTSLVFQIEIKSLKTQFFSQEFF